jgi:hypothetical protein
MKKILLLLIFLISLNCSFINNTDQENKTIDLFIDNKLLNRYYFDNADHIYKIIESVNDSIYKKKYFLYYNNKKNIEIFNDNNKMSKDFVLSNYFKSIEYYNKCLNKKGVNIDNYILVSNEINDFYKILSNIEKENHKKYYHVSKHYKFENLSLNIRFYPSTIEKFIPMNSVIHEFSFMLNSKGKLKEEEIKFNDGILNIKFFYKKNRIENIFYFLKYNDGNTIYQNKKYKIPASASVPLVPTK